MKKAILTMFFILLISSPIFAEGLYFDGGIGFGKPTTTIDGNDVSEVLAGTGVDEIGVDLELKLGYGPIAGENFYIAGVLEGIGHRFDDGINYIQYNSYLVGPSIVFYPIPLLQLSGSAGYSWVSNDTDISGITFYDSDSGYAYDVSAAVDIGSGNHGVLIGAKYFRAYNTLETSGSEEVSSMFSIFVQYAYRQKQ